MKAHFPSLGNGARVALFVLATAGAMALCLLAGGSGGAGAAARAALRAQDYAQAETLLAGSGQNALLAYAHARTVFDERDEQTYAPALESLEAIRTQDAGEFAGEIEQFRAQVAQWLLLYRTAHGAAGVSGGALAGRLPFPGLPARRIAQTSLGEPDCVEAADGFTYYRWYLPCEGCWMALATAQKGLVVDFSLYEDRALDAAGA